MQEPPLAADMFAASKDPSCSQTIEPMRPLNRQKGRDSKANLKMVSSCNYSKTKDIRISKGLDTVLQIASRLKGHGIESGRVNAEVMLSDILGCRRLDLYIDDITLNRQQLKRLEEMVSRRINGEPLQYIRGKADFYGYEFLIGPGVFIPRPETEVLVHTVLNLAGGYGQRTANRRPFILDLGTGSGNIAISLTKGFKCCRVIGSDISAEAIKLARRNASLHGVSDRIEFIKADMFDMPVRYKDSFDIIVSNPPYIAKEELEALADDVKKEPLQALDGGESGVNFYSRTIKESPPFLKRGGIIALELADGICDKVKEMLEGSGRYGSLKVYKDLNDTDRVITAVRSR